MVNICKKLSNPLIVIFKGMVLPYFWEINVLYVIHYEYNEMIGVKHKLTGFSIFHGPSSMY